jgi:GGDEF domain-containing protein
MSDVSFLSLANDAGHKVGDDLLKEISYILKTEDAGAFRHGGDEITGIKKEDSDEAIRERIITAKMKINSLSGVANLDHYNLQPNVDFGEAEVREAIAVLQNLLNSENEEEKNINRKRILAGEPLRSIQNIWVEIADKRCQINKGTERLLLLFEKKINEPTMCVQLMGYLKKGGYNIELSELEALIKEIDELLSRAKCLNLKDFLGSNGDLRNNVVAKNIVFGSIASFIKGKEIEKYEKSTKGIGDQDQIDEELYQKNKDLEILSLVGIL